MATFDDRARTWDTPERQARARAVAGMIRSAVALSPSSRLIDVGAGTGLLGLALLDDVGELVLAEPSHGMREVTVEKVAGLRNVTVIPFELLMDPAPVPGFDVAVSLLVLHHLRDTAAALAAIRELLVPGGRIALADLDTEDGSFHSAEAEGIHHHGFDRAALGALARAAGFADVEVRTAGKIEHDGRPYPVFLLLGTRPADQPAG